MMDITSSIIHDFRNVQLAFESVSNWPDRVVKLALIDADAETGGTGWGEYPGFKQRGMFLFAAHLLITDYPTGCATDQNNVSPTPKFAVQSKSVGDESVSYANGAVSSANIGDTWLSSTNYGFQFMRQRKHAGMGARAV